MKTNGKICKLATSAGKHVKALTNEDTLLPTQFCIRDTENVSDFNQNILCLQQMFPSLRGPRNIMGNNMSATMCPRLPGPYTRFQCYVHRRHIRSSSDMPSFAMLCNLAYIKMITQRTLLRSNSTFSHSRWIYLTSHKGSEYQEVIL